MVTRLSGTPSFAKSRLKKLIKAASGGLFYARQRVTTEGKGMGTRHLTCVVKDGDYKVAQYGQWDGYPSGQGIDILTFLREELNRDVLLPKLSQTFQPIRSHEAINAPG